MIDKTIWRRKKQKNKRKNESIESNCNLRERSTWRNGRWIPSLF